MGLRLLVMSGAVALLVGVFDFPPLALILGLLVLYIANLVLEISFLQKKVAQKP
jgi:hypothetical protein